jgi:alanyl-tRNA synthetase
VLRRIVRRAVRHFWKLNTLQPEGQFWRMLQPLIETMGQAYPELIAKRGLIERALKAEEAAFAQTLDAGMLRLRNYLEHGQGRIDGEQLFLLHDTYGCPPDLINDILREQGVEPVGGAMAQYEDLMDQQRARARGASKFASGSGLPAELVASLPATEFTGYETLTNDAAVLALLREGVPVASIVAGEEAMVVLDRTPFYAESGGQVGDTGTLTTVGGDLFQVRDTIKFSAIFHGHIGQLAAGTLKVGDKLSAQVDVDRRQAIVLNHSATHLLHAALRKVLGEHVSQKGSLVAPDRLRFDFSHFQPIGAAELARIEAIVNDQIRRNAEVEVRHMDMAEALDFGAMALFGEKYGERVRVLRMGEFSTELCGGTHVKHAGDIGVFKILSESGVAAGVRRIDAATGAGALAYFAEQERRLEEAAGLLGGRGEDVVEKLRQLLDRQKKLERDIDAYKAKAAAAGAADLAADAIDLGGIKLIAARIDGLDAKALRETIDALKSRLNDAVIVLASAEGGKASLVAGVQGSALGKVKAGELLAHVASQIGGKGGGRPDMAQGGGADGPALVAALAGVRAWVEQRLG